jgi:Uma2 family endonuclease
MSAVPFPVTERQIDDRRRLGIDKRDERWAGEWHLVNPPKFWHDQVSMELALVLAPLAKARGMRAAGGPHGVFGAADDWRVPDQVYALAEDVRDEGVVSAELVVEIRSPGDDSYRKLGFYAARGVGEVLILHEDRRVELFRLGEDGVLAPVAPDGDGGVCCRALGVTFTAVAGPRLRVAWDGGCAEV